MERVTLAKLVALAKYINSDKAMYRPGMEITYTLDPTNHELLQQEVYVHTYKVMDDYKSAKKFEFEVMDVVFILLKTT